MNKTIPLTAGKYYHVYNRGINGESIFKEEKSYHKFLELYEAHVHPVVDTIAYCLLGNHFHLIIRPRQDLRDKYTIYTGNIDGSVSSERVSKQFSHFFNGYAQSFNKLYERTGALFETPFRRKEVENVAYLNQLIHYVHSNPQKHGLVDDYKEWAYSSYGRDNTELITSHNFSIDLHDEMDMNLLRPFILDMEEITG
jgi:REP element-mobilizing transposase RayT